MARSGGPGPQARGRWRARRAWHSRSAARVLACSHMEGHGEAYAQATAWSETRNASHQGLAGLGGSSGSKTREEGPRAQSAKAMAQGNSSDCILRRGNVLLSGYGGCCATACNAITTLARHMPPPSPQPPSLPVERVLQQLPSLPRQEPQGLQAVDALKGHGGRGGGSIGWSQRIPSHMGSTGNPVTAHTCNGSSGRLKPPSHGHAKLNEHDRLCACAVWVGCWYAFACGQSLRAAQWSIQTCTTARLPLPHVTQRHAPPRPAQSRRYLVEHRRREPKAAPAERLPGAARLLERLGGDAAGWQADDDAAAAEVEGQDLWKEQEKGGRDTRRNRRGGRRRQAASTH